MNEQFNLPLWKFIGPKSANTQPQREHRASEWNETEYRFGVPTRIMLPINSGIGESDSSWTSSNVRHFLLERALNLSWMKRLNSSLKVLSYLEHFNTPRGPTHVGNFNSSVIKTEWKYLSTKAPWFRSVVMRANVGGRGGGQAPHTCTAFLCRIGLRWSPGSWWPAPGRYSRTG